MAKGTLYDACFQWLNITVQCMVLFLLATLAAITTVSLTVVLLRVPHVWDSKVHLDFGRDPVSGDVFMHRRPPHCGDCAWVPAPPTGSEVDINLCFSINNNELNVHHGMTMARVKALSRNNTILIEAARQVSARWSPWPLQWMRAVVHDVVWQQPNVCIHFNGIIWQKGTDRINVSLDKQLQVTDARLQARRSISALRWLPSYHPFLSCILVFPFHFVFFNLFLLYFGWGPRLRHLASAYSCTIEAVLEATKGRFQPDSPFDVLQRQTHQERLHDRRTKPRHRRTNEGSDVGSSESEWGAVDESYSEDEGAEGGRRRRHIAYLDRGKHSMGDSIPVSERSELLSAAWRLEDGERQIDAIVPGQGTWAPSSQANENISSQNSSQASSFSDSEDDNSSSKKEGTKERGLGGTGQQLKQSSPSLRKRKITT